MIGKRTPPTGRVTVNCPHCAFEQLESPYAKSTFCRRCGEHFELGKPRAAESGEKSESLFARFGGLFSNNKDRDVTCFNCKGKHVVSGSAKSTLCPFCSGYIDLTDIKIKSVSSRRIETQGNIHVTAKGEITSPRVICADAFVEGIIRGNLLSSGETRLRFKGKFPGGLDVNQLVVEKRSDVEMVRPIKARAVEISGRVTANLEIDGTVTVTRRGWLEGDVVARALNVEKGGHFKGKFCFIPGKASAPQADPMEEDDLPLAESAHLEDQTENPSGDHGHGHGLGAP